MKEAIRSLTPKPSVDIDAGKYAVRTISSEQDLSAAFRLRFQAFQVEMAGLENKSSSFDTDDFDVLASHLGVFDKVSNQLIATCRLLSSHDTHLFYSAQEFDCRELLSRPETKLEIGRVCVHSEYRRGIVILLLWRGIAEFMTRSKSQILFGCGSVGTLDPILSAELYLYLKNHGKVIVPHFVKPNTKYSSFSFDQEVLLREKNGLSPEACRRAEGILPPLCRMYFDIGCQVAGPPAFDRDFNCIDFFTFLEVEKLDPKLKQKMFGVKS